MRPMLYKEFLAERPQLIAILLIGCVLFVGELLSPNSLGGLAEMLTGGTESLLLVTGGLAFALGHGQIGPEVVHGHVEFLDGLPVVRWQVYVAKVVAGLASVALLVAVIAAGYVAMTQLAWGASGGDTMVTVFFSLAVGLFSFYATGLLCSWFGGFGWALLILGLSVVTTFAEASETLRPLSLFHGYGTVRFEANVPLVVVWPMNFWGIYGVICCALSGALFIGRGDQIVRAGSSFGRASRMAALALVGGLLLLMAAITGTRLAARGRPPDDAAVTRRAGAFRVLVPQALGDSARPLIERMPAIDTGVRAVLDIATPLTLDVELGGGGRFHAGLYTGGKIRMALDGDPAHTFAHELAHAYADQLADGRLRLTNDALRFFNEGLAMWVADQVTAQPDQSDPFRAWAAAIYTMGHHPIDLLMNDRARARRFDPFEPYPLGLTFVEAFIATAGTPAIRCVLSAVGRLPEDRLAGVAVWAHLAETCRVDLAKVSAAYTQKLATYAERWPMPNVSWLGQPIRTSDGLFIALAADLPSEVEPVPTYERRCRFRSRVSAAVADLDETLAVEGRCAVQSVIGATNTVSYQVGVRLRDGWTAYGPWIQQPIPSESIGSGL